MDTIYSASLIGLFSSILTEIIKMALKPTASDNEKRLVAFLCSFLLTLNFYFASGRSLNWTSIYEIAALFLTVLVSSYALYKSVIQNLNLPTRFSKRKVYGTRRSRKQRTGSNKA